MNAKLPKPAKGSVIYEDAKLYACLASHPIARGHVVVVWKAQVKDLHLLKRQDYLYLMDKVDVVRNAMLKALNIKKVYLIYMDEANQVHWHLVPRYNVKGYDALLHRPGKLKDMSLALEMKSYME